MAAPTRKSLTRPDEHLEVPGITADVVDVAGALEAFRRLLAERGGDASMPFTARPPFHPLRLCDLAGLAEVAEKDEEEGRPPV